MKVLRLIASMKVKWWPLPFTIMDTLDIAENFVAINDGGEIVKRLPKNFIG